MGSLHKNMQLMLVPQGAIRNPTLLLQYIKDPPDYVIRDTAIYADNTILYSKCDQISDLWPQIGLTFELESELRDTVEWRKKGLADFYAMKTQVVLFDQSNNNGAIDMKMNGFVLQEKIIS